MNTTSMIQPKMRVRIEVVNLAAGELVIEIEIIRVVEIVVHQWLLWDNHFWGGDGRWGSRFLRNWLWLLLWLLLLWRGWWRRWCFWFGRRWRCGTGYSASGGHRAGSGF